MALPSSPPLLPEPDLPSSPVHLPSSSNIPPDPPNRKRQLPDYSNISSDPLFSEDASEAEGQLGNDRVKRKKMVRGPWWRLAERRVTGSSLESDSQGRVRNLDSGVFMGSDLSEDSIDGFAAAKSGQWTLTRSEWPYKALSKSSVTQAPPEVERVVQECVETGSEAVDLSEHGIELLTPRLLTPLQQLIRQSHNDLTHPPSEDEFSTLTPSIKLFLARNRISSLPPELFQLENITVLSLRSNQLSELPPSFSRLRRLEELNVAGNTIRYLPWELFHLFECHGVHKQITVRPNPLIEPAKIEGRSPLSNFPSEVLKLDWSGEPDLAYDGLKQHFLHYGSLDVRAELELRLNFGRIKRANHLRIALQAGERLNVCREQLIYLASSAVRYFEADGVPRQRINQYDSPWTPVFTDLGPPSSYASSSSPSLFELALKTAQSCFHLDEVPGSFPYKVKAGLQRAHHGVIYGNQTCSTCGAAFVLPRAEWMEYWFNGFQAQAELTQEAVLPFLRRACSWRCAVPSRPGEFRV